MSKQMFYCMVLLSMLFFSCAAALLPEEQAYMEKVNQAPLNFSIPGDKAEEAWSRANSFVANYSSVRITTANDYTIQTFSPNAGSGVSYGYSVTRVKKGDAWDFSVNCACNNIFMTSYAARNAHILSLYISSGDLPYPKFVSK